MTASEYKCQDCIAFSAGERVLKIFPKGTYLATGRCTDPLSRLYNMELVGAFSAMGNAGIHNMDTLNLRCFRNLPEKKFIYPVGME